MSVQGWSLISAKMDPAPRSPLETLSALLTLLLPAYTNPLYRCLLGSK